MQNVVDPPTDPDSTIQLRGSDPKHIEKIYSMLEDIKQKEVTESAAATQTPMPIKSADTEELTKYRELERLSILKELPKDIQEEFSEKTLKQVKDIDKVYRSFIKKDVGQTPPSTGAPAEKEKVYGWNPLTFRNEEH